MRSSHHHKHHARRLLCLTALACFVAGGTAYACTRKASVPQLPELPAESLALPAENGAQQSTLTAAQAQALLDDPRMILVSRTHPITEDTHRPSHHGSWKCPKSVTQPQGGSCRRQVR